MRIHKGRNIQLRYTDQRGIVKHDWRRAQTAVAFARKQAAAGNEVEWRTVQDQSVGRDRWRSMDSLTLT